jgi:hypothetical protein
MMNSGLDGPARVPMRRLRLDHEDATAGSILSKVQQLCERISGMQPLDCGYAKKFYTFAISLKA